MGDQQQAGLRLGQQPALEPEGAASAEVGADPRPKRGPERRLVFVVRDGRQVAVSSPERRDDRGEPTLRQQGSLQATANRLGDGRMPKQPAQPRAEPIERKGLGRPSQARGEGNRQPHPQSDPT